MSRRIECPVTEFIVGIVCEPTQEKLAPASDSHGRVSLQYSLAEALTSRVIEQERLCAPVVCATAISWSSRAA